MEGVIELDKVTVLFKPEWKGRLIVITVANTIWIETKKGEMLYTEELERLLKDHFVYIEDGTVKIYLR